jgi:hypothetical protein
MGFQNTPMGYFSGSVTPALEREEPDYDLDPTPLSQANERRESQRRDSIDSVKSLKSYHTIRESLSSMHHFVDKLFKEVSTSKVLERNSAAKSDFSGCSLVEEEQSQNLEAIHELNSENEHSHIGKLQQEKICPGSILKAKDNDFNIIVEALPLRVKCFEPADVEMNDENVSKENLIAKKSTTKDITQKKIVKTEPPTKRGLDGARVRVKISKKDILKIGEKQKFEERFKSQKIFEEDNPKQLFPKRNLTHTVRDIKNNLDKKGCCGVCNTEIFYY